VTHRYPPQTGGVETHVREVSERLVDRGHHVTVVSADAGSSGHRRERREGVVVERMSAVAPGGTTHVAPGVFRAVREADADIVHAHNYHAIPALFAALGTDGDPFVLTTHYHGRSASSLRNLLLTAYRPVGRRVVRGADRVIAVSNWEKRRLQSDFSVDAAVIPNGLDIARFANATPTDRPEPYLLCVGRLERYKGVQHVIRALPELEGFDLLVAGTGPYREELERVATAEGVRDRTEFLGFVDHDRLPRLYAGASAYLLLSSFEAYGMTVAESLTAGTPCVVRRGSALDDWTSDSGVVGVEGVDSRLIAEAVEAARSRDPDPGSVQSWDSVVDELLMEYNQVTG